MVTDMSVQLLLCSKVYGWLFMPMQQASLQEHQTNGEVHSLSEQRPKVHDTGDQSTIGSHQTAVLRVKGL